MIDARTGRAQVSLDFLSRPLLYEERIPLSFKVKWALVWMVVGGLLVGVVR